MARASAILRNSGTRGPRISWTRWCSVIAAGRHLGGRTGRPTRLFATPAQPMRRTACQYAHRQVALPLCRRTLGATGLPGTMRKAVIDPAMAVVAQAAVSIAIPSTARTAVVTSVPKLAYASAACTPPFMPVHDACDQAQQLRLILAIAPSTAHN